MQLRSESSADGVSARHFTVGNVPGVLWTPAAATGPFPVVLIAHGGGQHKLAPGIVARARRYVVHCGFAAVSLDAPGHGNRPRTERDELFTADLRAKMSRGEPVADHITCHNAELAAEVVPEWQATLDALQELDEVGTAAPIGFWGVSLGTAIGVPLIAAEPRIKAAVLGLVDYPSLAQWAPSVTIPVEFLLQWDDELVSRVSGLALFEALGSKEKTLHANPGGHLAVPAFELDSAERFFARHLEK